MVVAEGGCGVRLRGVNPLAILTRMVKLYAFPVLFPLAIIGVRKGWWSFGYAAELCGLSYITLYVICRRMRIKVFTVYVEDVEV